MSSYNKKNTINLDYKTQMEHIKFQQNIHFFKLAYIKKLLFNYECECKHKCAFMNMHPFTNYYISEKYDSIISLKSPISKSNKVLDYHIHILKILYSEKYYIGLTKEQVDHFDLGRKKICL